METTQLLIVEAVCHWVAVSFYLMATAFFTKFLVNSNHKNLTSGWWLSLIGMIPHTLSLGIRWYAVGHGPYLQQAESLSFLAYGAIGMFLAFSHKAPKLKSIGVILMPCALLLLALRFFSAPGNEMPPATFTGIWFIIHTISIVPAMGAFVIALGASVLYLLPKRGGGFSVKLPAPEVLDAYNHQFAGLAFICWGIMIIAGAIWAEQSWGRYWGWDAIETWSLITWIFLGLLLHLRRFFDWQGKNAAWAMIFCFMVSVVTLFFLSSITGSIHSEYLL
ncbi:MAG: cytochrome c biogenesis protein CcsA [Desulfobulbaceae bacterium]|nr:cytochrome c biogenesis protein CcsA [Desulfobulbaceae bacterium]